MSKAPVPVDVKLLTQSRKLLLEYDDGNQFEFSFEFLRVHSPSAEVKGHGPDDGELPLGKEQVAIIDIEPVGNYALKLLFDDGHDSGLYSWQYFLELGHHRDQLWEQYLSALAMQGYERSH